MTIPTARQTLRLAALLSSLPLAAQAATFKCMVDGRTTYQQSPCNASTEAQGGAAQMQIKTAPSDRSSPVSAEDMAKRKIKLRDDGTHVARAAVQMLIDGKVDAYVANLCPDDRKGWSQPTMKESLRYMGANLAKRHAQLGLITDSGMSELTFMGIEDPGSRADSSQPMKPFKVRAHFGWDLGKICLRVLNVTDH